jgi:hypothetical protein
LVVAEVLRRVGHDLTRSRFVEALGKLDNFRAEAYFGPITCRAPANHQCNQNPGWALWKDGRMVEFQ